MESNDILAQPNCPKYYCSIQVSLEIHGILILDQGKYLLFIFFDSILLHHLFLLCFSIFSKWIVQSIELWHLVNQAWWLLTYVLLHGFGKICYFVTFLLHEVGNVFRNLVNCKACFWAMLFNTFTSNLVWFPLMAFICLVGRQCWLVSLMPPMPTLFLISTFLLILLSQIFKKIINDI